MRWYLDASVAAYAMLPGGDPRARSWLDAAVSARDLILSSTLLELELTRTLRRERLDLDRAAGVVSRIQMVTLDDTILRLAAAIEPHVKTLDAIHLATCRELGPGVTLVTHDGAMLNAAAALNLNSYDPLAP